MAKQLIKEYIFTPGAAGVSTIKIPKRYSLDKLLLITNVTDNIIIYNFADTAFAGTTAVFTAVGKKDAVDADYPTIWQAEGGYTIITLQYNTSSMSASDDLQIFCESTDNYGQIVRPWDFGTDAIERTRVSNPQSLIDADFEYGLQPTKWAGYGTVKGYPSAYDVPGVDLNLTSITTDYTTTSSANSLITVQFTDSSAHGLSIGDVINISGLDAGTAGFSRADGNFVVDAVPSSTSLKYFARGVVGTSAGQSIETEEALARIGKLYANSSIPVASAASDGSDPSEITLTMTNPHGLIPGTPIHVITGSGTNKDHSTGPFVIYNTPADNQIKFTARSGAVVSNPSNITLYAFSNATILHRPSDGGVILSTKTPTYAASVVRQSKRFFRYQSGKGLLFSSGTLFAPNYDVQTVSAGGTSIGSTISVKTDDIDHGLQAGAEIRLEGVKTSGYNDTYIVDGITDDFTFTVLAKSVLGDTNAILEEHADVYVTAWTGAAVRGGVFDEQNGIFFEFDGQQMFCVRRAATDNVAGTVAVTKNGSVVTGSNTRFTEQLRAGDKIVIRGMTHFVTKVDSNTTLYVTPDYRGITASGIRSQKVTELRIPQSKWNLDKADGTGPSGYNWDFNTMQMIGIEWSWYGAGFAHFMVRGPDGNWIYIHRIKNNNVNDEAYMRSSNLPVRYSIDNDAPLTYLTNTIDSNTTTIPVANLQEFADTGMLYIDNEIIKYTGRSTTDGAGNFTGCTREATFQQYLQGNTSTLSAGGKTTHSTNTGILEISNTCSPTLSHWGSSLIMDGGFERDRGFLFTHKESNIDITTTPKTAFCIRLAPSVSNALTGRLGAKELLNRSQMLVEEVAVSVGRSGGFFSSVGEIVVEGILNPRNFQDAGWQGLNATNRGGQPSFAQVAGEDNITWSSGNYAQPGELIFSYVASSSNSGSVVSNLDLTKLKEMSGAPLGGDFMYPDGPDILAINIYMIFGSSKGSVALRWIEAQA
jgi:hypothetical protein